MRPLWYVIHCEPQQDRQVARLAGHQGLESFAPRIPKNRKRDGDKPLFPGYVFARLDLGVGDGARLRYLPGIRRLVQIGGGPCAVEDRIIAAIRARVAAYQPRTDPLTPGERVRVTTGSFAELEGIFCEALSGEERVAILMDMMRRQVRVELPVHEVERVVREPAA